MERNSRSLEENMTTPMNETHNCTDWHDGHCHDEEKHMDAWDKEEMSEADMDAWMETNMNETDWADMMADWNETDMKASSDWNETGLESWNETDWADLLGDLNDTDLEAWNETDWSDMSGDDWNEKGWSEVDMDDDSMDAKELPIDENGRPNMDDGSRPPSNPMDDDSMPPSSPMDDGSKPPSPTETSDS